MTTPAPHRILGLCGSLRSGSLNRRLLELAAAYARAQKVEVDILDLRALGLPLYDGDLEAHGLPAPVVELRDRMARAQGLLIASPEYNHSIPAGLKNALDWASRIPMPVLDNKWAALMGASMGPFATARMQPHLRQVLASLGVNVLPAQVLLPRAHDAFTESGTLKEPARLQEVVGLVNTLVARVRS